MSLKLSPSLRGTSSRTGRTRGTRDPDEEAVDGKWNAVSTDGKRFMSWIEEQPESNRKLLEYRLPDAPEPELEAAQARIVVGIDGIDQEGMWP